MTLNPAFANVLVMIGVFTALLGLGRIVIGLNRGEGPERGLPIIIFGAALAATPSFLPVLMDAVIRMLGGEPSARSTSRPSSSPSTSASPTPDPTPTPTSAPTPTPTSTPVPTKAPAPSEPFDWTFLLWFLGVALVLIVAVILIFVWRAHLGPKASAAVAARKVRAEQIKAGQKAWTAARTQFGVAQTTWLSYEKDLQRAMDFPLMRDMHNPLVQRTVSAMSAARAFDLSGAPVIAEGIEPTQQPFVVAVREFVDALSAAETQARVARRTRLSKDHQKALKLADRLLKIAQNDGASPYERQSALRQLTKTLEGIIDVPAEAIAQIETVVRIAIEGPAPQPTPEQVRAHAERMAVR